MSESTKDGSAKKAWRSIKLPEDVDNQVREFAHRHRLSLADAYSVIVGYFARQSEQAQAAAIRPTS